MDCIKSANISSQEILCGVYIRTAGYVDAPRNGVLFFFANDHARVCVASTCKLLYWNRARYSHDLTFDIWPVTICTQTIQCMSILSFCFLYLKPLFKILDSGFIRSDEFRRKGQMNAERPYNLSILSSGKKSRKEGKISAALARTEHSTPTFTALANEAGWDGGSQNSEAQIIRETRTFAIENSVAGENRVSL